MEQVRKSVTTLGSWWSDLSAGRRTAILGCVAVLVVGYLVFRVLARPTYGTLFTDLPSDDFNRVVDWLDTKKTPFETERSDTVRIPENMVITTRAQMAKEGIPAIGHIVGKEDLEQTSFSETRAQFEKRVQRMVEGEVTRTILLFDDVKSAKVNIAFPDNAPLFAEDKVPLTAAVSVTQRNPSSILASSTVDAIASIVANSVSDLAPQRVTIVDSRGRRYHADAAADGVSASEVSAQANERRDEETEIEEDLIRALGGVVGQKNVRVVASVELEWANESVKRKELLPNPDTGKPYTISEQNEEESYIGSGVQGGVPGTEPSVPTTPTGTPPTYPTTAQAGPINYSRSSSTKNNDTGILETERKSLSPKLVKKSIGVFLNENAVTAAEQARIQTTAAAQAGIDAARGDVLVVQRVPFGEEAAAQAEIGGPKFSRFVVPLVVAALGLLIPVVLSRMAAPPRRRAVDEEEEPLEETAAPSPVSWDGLFEEPGPSEEELLRQELAKRMEATFDTVRRLAEERPEDFASTLRAWLADD
jgi:flagellar M-ring protein FliF